MKRHRESGMTLVEVVIAAIILAVIIALTFSILISSQSAYNEASIAQSLEDRGRKFMDFHKKDMMFCKVLTIADDGSLIRYQTQLPAIDQVTGVVTNPGDQQWGYFFNGNQVGWYCELEFMPQTVMVEDIGGVPGFLGGTPVQDLNGIDINSDGDVSDIFVQGKVEKRVYDDLGNLVDTSTAADFVMLLVATGGVPGLYGDIDADGLADRLFSVLDSNGSVITAVAIASSGVKLRINIWHGNFTDLRVRFVLKNLRDEWNFRNSQS